MTNLEETNDEKVEVCDAPELLKEVLEDEREEGVFGRCDVVVGVLFLSLARKAADRDTPALFCLVFSSEEPYFHFPQAQCREKERGVKKSDTERRGWKKKTEKQSNTENGERCALQKICAMNKEVVQRWGEKVGREEGEYGTG